MRFRIVPWLLLPALLLALTDGSDWALQGDAVAAGGWWRLWSGHWCHFGWEHLFWDGLVFVLLTAFLERRLPRRQLLLLVVAVPPLLSLGLLALLPDGAQYRGLSGLNTFLLTLAARLIWQTGDRTARWGSAALLLLWLGKTAWEATGGIVWHPLPQGVVFAWQAHALGMALGLMWAWGGCTPRHRYDLNGAHP